MQSRAPQGRGTASKSISVTRSVAQSSLAAANCAIYVAESSSCCRCYTFTQPFRPRLLETQIWTSDISDLYACVLCIMHMISVLMLGKEHREKSCFSVLRRILPLLSRIDSFYAESNFESLCACEAATGFYVLTKKTVTFRVYPSG